MVEVTGVEQGSIEAVESKEFDASRVLFIGVGKTAVMWYRCALPALFMGADWVGMIGQPPAVRYETGLVKGETVIPRLEDYDIVVIQQPRGTAWLNVIRRLQSRGIKVLFEVDDYLHAIHKMPDHDFREDFDKPALKALELNMRVCDGIIASTAYIARRYRRFNKRTYTCENGIDLGRYRLTLPERPKVNIGWAGATGHVKAVIPWLQQAFRVMHMRDDTCFASIGQDFAGPIREHFPDRAITVPFTMLDIYPAAMTLFDIALAPAGQSNFFRGKSDLRWVEAGALGIPIVADPAVYPEIEHGVTGFHAETPARAGELLLELVDDPKLRLQVGANAREYIRAHRGMDSMVVGWQKAFTEVLA